MKFKIVPNIRLGTKCFYLLSENDIFMGTYKTPDECKIAAEIFKLKLMSNDVEEFEV